MKATYDFFKEIALIYVTESINVTECNSLLLLVNKIAEVGIKQVVIDLSKAQPESQVIQLLITAKPKLRNGKNPQGLFVGRPDDSVGDFKSITEALDRFPSGEGLKVKEMLSLQAEMEEMKARLKNVEGVLKMPGSIEQKQKAIQQKNNYLNRINANLDSELAWLATEIKYMRNEKPPAPPESSVAETYSVARAQTLAFFDEILNATTAGDESGKKKPS